MTEAILQGQKLSAPKHLQEVTAPKHLQVGLASLRLHDIAGIVLMSVKLICQDRPESRIWICLSNSRLVTDAYTSDAGTKQGNSSRDAVPSEGRGIASSGISASDVVAVAGWVTLWITASGIAVCAVGWLIWYKALRPQNAVMQLDLVPRTSDIQARADLVARTSDGKCVVCLEHDSTMALLPCGHKCACENCAQKLVACPICRRPVNEVRRIFDA
jgi:hypothetical protein